MAAELRKKLKGNSIGSTSRETRTSRAKSVDYLVDKIAREEIEPPENQLKKVLCNDVETRMSSNHELRFRKSLEKLQIPDWYLNSEYYPTEYERSTSPFSNNSSWTTPNSPATFSSYSRRSSSPRQEVKTQTPILIAKFSEAAEYATRSTTPPARYREDKTIGIPLPKVEISSTPKVFETTSNIQEASLSRVDDKLTIPKNFFEKFKWELEEARRNRVNLRQHNNNNVLAEKEKRDITISNTINLQSSALTPKENLENVSGKELVEMQISDSDWKTVHILEDPVPKIERRNSNYHSNGKGLLVSDMSDNKNKMNEMSKANGQSVVVEVSDVLSGNFTNEIAKVINETLSLKEILDNFFELSKITPPAQLLHETSSNSNERSKENKNDFADYGIYTANQSVMYICAKDPKNAGNLLKKENLRLKCEMCLVPHRINGSRDPFVSCIYCYTYYCNRLCRKRSWKRHVQKCDYAKVSSVCRKILNLVRKNPERIMLTFNVARLGYERRGRGCVNFVFRNFDSAKSFVDNQSQEIPIEKFFYQTLSELEISKSDLSKACTSYDPLSEFLLNVCVVIAIDDVAETPASTRRLSDVLITTNELTKENEVVQIADINSQPLQRARSLPYRKKSKRCADFVQILSKNQTDVQILKSVLKSLENIAPGPIDIPKQQRKSSIPVSPSDFDRKNVYRHTVGISGRKYYRSIDGSFSPINCNGEFKFPTKETDV